MKKILTSIVIAAGLLLPLSAGATVFSANQIIITPSYGVVMATSTASAAKLQASSSPNLASINATSTTATSSLQNTSVNQFKIATLSGILRAVSGFIQTTTINLASDVSGVLPVPNGGTGWAAIQSGAIPYGNGSGALATTTAGTNGQVLALLSGIPTWTASTTFSSPLLYSAGNVTCQVASGSLAGCLSSADWTTFNNKQSTITLTTTGTSGVATFIGGTLNIPNYANTIYTAAFPITLTGTTFGFGGLSTTTNLTVGQVPYVTGVNTFGQEATGTISQGTGITVTGIGYDLGAGITITNAGVTSNVAGTGIGVSGATGAVTISNTGVTSIVAGTNVTISGATGAVTINSTAGGTGTVTSIALVGLDGATPITTTGTITAQISTSTVPSVGGLAYWTGAGTPSTLGTVATSSETCSSPISCTAHTVLAGGGAITLGTVPYANGGTGSTTAPEGQVLYGGQTAYQSVATSSVSSGTGISFSGTAGALVGGTNLTITNTGVTSLGNGTGITCTGTAPGSCSLASMAAGVLGTPVTGIPTSQATSTLYGAASTGGFVLQWSNVTNGLVLAATSTSGGSGITAITGPTGLTFSGSPTSVGTLAIGFSIKEVPSYTVCASGCDFTTLQAALNAAGTAGGGTILPTDPTYTQGATGLKFMGSNTTIQCRTATTTITFTGATNYFATNLETGDYSQDGVTGCTVTGDGNTASNAFEISNLNHFDLENNTVNNVGSFIEASDTQSTTYYERIVHNNATTLTKFGINASSTLPINGWYIQNNFIGCNANCTSIQFDNGNGNNISDNYLEPGSLTGTIGLNLFDNTVVGNDGFFNNQFTGNYIEANGKGIQVAKSLNGSGGGVQRNYFANNTVEANTLDYNFPGAATSTVIALQTWTNNYNSNFDNPLTSFQGPFGVGTSSEMANISATVPTFTYFGISPQAGISTNDFTIGSSSATLLNVNNAGQLQVDNGGQINQVTSGTAIPLQVEANSAGVPIGLSVFDNGFANTSDLVKINQVNGSDSGPALHILDAGTGPALYVQTGNSGFGTSSPQWEIDAANATKPQLSLTDGTLTSTPWDFRSISGAFYLSTSSLTTFATSTNALFSIIPSATANATTTFSLTDWVLKQTSQTALLIQDAFGTNDVAVNTASTTGSIFTAAATTSPSIFSPIKLFDVDQYGHLTASSTGPAQPTVTCVPSGGTISSNSNDDIGTITGGTLSTSCTVTFARAYAVAPIVQSTGSNIFTGVTAESTTQFTVSMIATTGDVINYWVVQP